MARTYTQAGQPQTLSGRSGLPVHKCCVVKNPHGFSLCRRKKWPARRVRIGDFSAAAMSPTTPPTVGRVGGHCKKRPRHTYPPHTVRTASMEGQKMAEMLTTTQAAKRADTSRPTISRALKSGDLPGNRGNDGKWLIKADDLDAWAGRRSTVHDEQCANSVHAQQKSPDFERLNEISRELDKTREALAEARQALARAEGENAANRERITDLTTDRDALRDALARAASHPQIVRPVGGLGGLWARLRSRG